MHPNKAFFRELVKQGYSIAKNKRVWDLSDGKLWCLTPELIEGYEKFVKYAPYKENVVEPEKDLLAKNAGMIFSLIHNPHANVLDLGSGDGKKASVFLKHLPKEAKVRYCPVDVSKELVTRAGDEAKKLSLPQVVGVKSYTGDFMDGAFGGLVRNSDYQKNILLLLGGTLSHVDLHDLLFTLSKEMFNGDVFVIGNGLRKGKRFVQLDKYNVPQLYKWFIHTMNYIGFNENEVTYKARFANGRLELYYTIDVDKKVECDGKIIYFRKGDEVLVAVQYKFFEKELRKACKMYFSHVELVKSDDGEYCLAICRK